ncbi:MAG: hypothetical protein AAF387_16415 [Pseudomonadota bacterium]
MRYTIITVTIIATLVSTSALANGQTKEECLRAAQIEHTVNLSSGIYTDKAQVTAPLHINLPATVDDRAYFECLVRNQLVDNDSAERYLARQDECRSKTRLLKSEAANGVARIGQLKSNAGFNACMELDIGVEVLDIAN